MSDNEEETDVEVVDPPPKIAGESNNKEIVFPVNFKHPNLPITAPDYSYVMDITDMKSLLIIKYPDTDEEDKIDEKNIDAITKVYSASNPE